AQADRALDAALASGFRIGLVGEQPCGEGLAPGGAWRGGCRLGCGSGGRRGRGLRWCRRGWWVRDGRDGAGPRRRSGTRLCGWRGWGFRQGRLHRLRWWRLGHRRLLGRGWWRRRLGCGDRLGLRFRLRRWLVRRRLGRGDRLGLRLRLHGGRGPGGDGGSGGGGGGGSGGGGGGAETGGGWGSAGGAGG